MDDAGAHTLAGIALFEGLDEGERGRIEGRCHWRRYQARQTVFDRESTSREVFFVVQGTVRVVNYTLSGREIAFATLVTGEYFGELAAIDALPRTASVQAIEDSLLAFLQANVFLDLLHRRGEIAFRVLERLVRVVRESTERIMDLSTLGAMQRVYLEILRLAVPDAASPDLWIVRPVPTEREIAGRTSTARETVARALSQLRQGGIVRRKGRNLYILDRARLEKIVEMLGHGGRT